MHNNDIITLEKGGIMERGAILPKVFAWMFVGLLVTFATGYLVSLYPNMLANVLSTGGFWIIVIIEFVLVIALSAMIHKMSPIVAKLCFILYSFVSGLTFSSIFIVYELGSIMYVFLITAGIFGAFALIGAKTKTDLTKLGTYLLMALLGVIVCLIINMFTNSSTFDLILSIITILIFIGFTAYDVQHVKYLSETTNINEDNLAIYGALELYLDFINIFLELIKHLGNNSD